jgi:hypothetical protein
MVARDGRRRMAQHKGHRYNMASGMRSFYPAFVNLWAQVRSQCFSAKAAFIYLFQLGILDGIYSHSAIEII